MPRTSLLPLFIFFDLRVLIQGDHGIDRLFRSGIRRNAMITKLHDSVLALLAALTFHDERFAQMLVCVVDRDDHIDDRDALSQSCRTDGTEDAVYIGITHGLRKCALYWIGVAVPLISTGLSGEPNIGMYARMRCARLGEISLSSCSGSPQRSK